MNPLNSEIKNRVDKVRADIEMHNLDAFLVSIPENVFYLTGRESGQTLVSKDDAVLWVKDLYRKIYRDLYSSNNYIFDVRTYKKDMIRRQIKKLKIKNLGIENPSVKNYNKLKDELGSTNLVISDIIEKRRMIKSDYETGLIRKSARIAKKGMDTAYSVVQEGIFELYAAAEIEFEIRRNGSETPSFREGMLLASGGNSADIHAKPSMKKIEDGLVVVDLGAKYSGYYSDMTRTIPVGRLSLKEKKILEFVKNLEMETIDRLKTGTKAADIHNFVEKRIRMAGYRFYHSAGHGVGLDVHESPSLSSESEDIIKRGMVFTIEPGIYIPNRFGVRFEDMVLLKGNKTEILTECG